MFNISFPVYANDLDSLVPEFWANETLATLEENLVAANLIHRDYSDLVASMGDVVNVQRPARLAAKRKSDSDNVTVQDATAANIAVALDQHWHTSFLIKDGQESKSRKDLVELFIKPAASSIAVAIDQVVLAQYAQFLNNVAGSLGQGTVSNLRGYMLDTRNVQNIALAPLMDRTHVLTPNTETLALNTDIFTSAEKRGDSGTALREASLGRVNGYDYFMDQNMGSISYALGVLSGAINLTAGYAAGTTSALVVDGFTGEVNVGDWVTIAGDYTPYRIKAKTATLGNTTGITLDRALRRAVLDNAVVTSYIPSAVNLAVGYAVGWTKEIVFDDGGVGTAIAPKVGQMISFEGTTVVVTTPVYVVIQATSTTILLDRPLEVALVDNQQIHIGPKGEYNFAFLRNALALITRPLALPTPGAGARAARMTYKSISMRACITYDGDKQGHLVTLDILGGVKKLYDEYGAVMFA